jgi:DNA gyrase subunit A
VLPLPEDEAAWGDLSVVFATAKGNVRRNSMDAFANIPSNGKFAMRFDDEDEDRLIGVALLDSGDDVLLASRQGKAIRFAADEVREFTSRTSTGVRGMALKGEDEVVSLSILKRVGATPEEREDYLRFAPWKGEKEGEPTLTAERYAYLAENEQFILTVCANGYGKLSSAYEYRRTGRGGQGITNIDNIARNGLVVASFPTVQAEQLMLVTDQAKLIRLPLTTLRVIGRGSAGVRLFNVADQEHVVSAVRLAEEEEEGEEVEAALRPPRRRRGGVSTLPGIAWKILTGPQMGGAVRQGQLRRGAGRSGRWLYPPLRAGSGGGHAGQMVRRAG